MTKSAVLYKPLTSLDHLRGALSQIESRIGKPSDSEEELLELFYLMDAVADRIEELRHIGADVRSEQARLDSAWERLQRNANSFVQRAGPALAAARQERDGQTLHPWWTLDLDLSQRARQRIGRTLLSLLAIALVLGAAGLIYSWFLAPPPEIQQAFAHMVRGQDLVEIDNLAAALQEFEAAAALVPDDPEVSIWIEVLRQATGDEQVEQDTQAAARAAGLEEWEYLFQRGMIFLQLDRVQDARADSQAAIDTAPWWGYGYYLRALTDETAGQFQTAIQYYQQAADLAHEMQDAELESSARVQIGLLMQYQESVR